VIRRTFRHFFLFLAAGLALASCARLAYLNASVAYSNATPLVLWTIDDYVDLTRGQKEWLRARLAGTMAWHRERELPEYRRFLESIAAHADRPFTEAEVASAYGILRDDYHRVVEHELADGAEFLAQLDSAQLAHLERRFAEENGKRARESVRGSPEERRERSVKRMIGHLEEWTGKLTAAQRRIVKARVGAFPPMIENRLADRKYRQGETLAIARERDRAKAVAALRRLLVDSDAWRRDEYRRKLGERDALAFQMIASLSATLSAGQRAHFKARIRGYVDDINRLASSG
jgi:hypothetical protein